MDLYGVKFLPKFQRCIYNYGNELILSLAFDWLRNKQ